MRRDEAKYFDKHRLYNLNNKKWPVLLSAVVFVKTFVKTIKKLKQ